VVINATRTIPRAAIQEVVARATVPWLRGFKDILEKPKRNEGAEVYRLRS